MKKLTREYTMLFNGLTDTLKELEELKQRIILLQQAAEQIVIEGEDVVYAGQEKQVS